MGTRTRRAPGAALAPIVALAALALAAPSAGGEGWARLAPTWDEALAEAARRNVPLLVILESNDGAPFVRLLQNPQLAAALDEKAIVLVGYRGGDHAPEKRVDRREKREVEVCPVYPQLTCAQHTAVYDTYAGRFDYEKLPAAFICRPNGQVILDKVEALGAAQIIQKLDDAQAGLGGGVFRSELDRQERKLQKGDEKLEEGKLAAARRVYDDEAEAAKKPLLQEIVAKRLERLDAKAVELIEAARALEGKARSDQLHKIEREMRGRAPAERAKAVMQELGIGE